MSKNINPLPDTVNGDKFFSARAIRTPIEVTISAAAFVAVTLDASCKGFHVSTRDASDYLLSDIVAGTTYATLKSGMFFDVAGESGDIVFYAKGTSSTTLEIIPFD